MPAHQKFCTLSFALIPSLIVSTLILSSAPASAQSAVPSTAKQAATMPIFASHLAQAASSRAPARPPARVLSTFTPRSPQDNVAYENGPVNGQVDAWTLNFGFAVSNTIQVNTYLQGLDFWAWLIPGDTITNIQVSIGTTPFGSDIFNGIVNLSQSGCFGNQFGYNVCYESGNFSQIPVSGVAWLTLQNANVPSGDPVYMDENSGAGCHSAGCPSQAEFNSIGTIPSEAFDVQGLYPHYCNGPSSPSQQAAQVRPGTTPGPLQADYSVIHDFTGGADGAYPSAGLSIDAAGKLYGPATSSGLHSAGNIYKLSPYGSTWILNLLYSFSGLMDGGNPRTPVVFGADHSIYGTSGRNGGAVFQLRPGALICRTASCGWNESILHAFPPNSSPNSLVVGPDGSLYGIDGNGGAYGKGQVYQLQPVQDGWRYNVLHDFGGGADGQNPLSLNVDQSGNLYGATMYGGRYSCGTVFQVSSTPGGWNKQTIYSFRGQEDSGYPLGLVIDRSGNLYGVTIAESCLQGNCMEPQGGSTVFMLTPVQGSWNYYLVSTFTGYYGANISIDSLANLYVNVEAPSYVFRLTPSGGAWSYTDMHDFSGADGSYPEGNIVVDSSGNIYGTTFSGGAYNVGVVWKMTP